MVSTSAEPPGTTFTQLNFNPGFYGIERLNICIHGNELDAKDAAPTILLTALHPPLQSDDLYPGHIRDYTALAIQDLNYISGLTRSF
jgi:hypothetical protein